MRYRSNRQYLHPVLRPGSDDYGLDASFFASCDPPQYDQTDGMLTISVRFDLDEQSLIDAVQSRRAKCAAMVYCGPTLYRGRLEASPSEPFVAKGRIPVSRLKNEVQVHPVILAEQDFVHSTATAHPEYQGQSVEISRLTPLATDFHWTFDINSDARPVRSIFRLQEDTSGRLRDGEFDINLDLGQDYVQILANSDTLAAFNVMRKEDTMPLPTVFTSAVLTVLAYVKELPEDTDDENCAWLRCVSTQLRRHNISIGNGVDTLLLAAQRLLQTPFAAMLEEFSESDDAEDTPDSYNSDDQEVD